MCEKLRNYYDMQNYYFMYRAMHRHAIIETKYDKKTGVSIVTRQPTISASLACEKISTN